MGSAGSKLASGKPDETGVGMKATNSDIGVVLVGIEGEFAEIGFGADILGSLSLARDSLGHGMARDQESGTSIRLKPQRSRCISYDLEDL